jgi:homoserine kinase type II
MATFTPMSADDGARIATAHGLGSCHEIIGVQAGTVNSNYFLVTDQGRVFVRLYEQQEADGVAYEWALLDHLVARGVPVPPRIKGPGPGELRVGGRPVAVFQAVSGEDVCQARVDAKRAYAVGAALARASKAGEDFPIVREGRFRLEDVARLLARASAEARPELVQPIARLTALHAELAANYPKLPQGVVHGDLFRDNVLWQDVREAGGSSGEQKIAALLDWESASHGTVIYDLAVTMLAWCCGDTLDWQLAKAMVAGYRSERELANGEWEGLWWSMRLGCLRFATTRIIDVYLKGTYPVGYKSFRRFLLRLDVIEQLQPHELQHKLG